MEWEEKVKSLDEELDRVKSELEGVRTAAAVSEHSRHDEIEQVERIYRQEVDSMQHVMKGWYRASLHVVRVFSHGAMGRRIDPS